MRNAEAIQKHWCLVFVAYSFVHLDCLPPSPMKGSLPIKTIGEACRQQAQALMQAVILYAHERLQLGQKAQDIFGYLFAKQQPVLARLGRLSSIKTQLPSHLIILENTHMFSPELIVIAISSTISCSFLAQ